MVKMVFIHLSSLSNLSEQLKGEQGMRSHEELEEQLIAFIKQMPTMKNKAELIEAIESIYNIDINTFQNLLEKSYKEFENWLNTLLSKEKIPKEIVAINFGIFDKKKAFSFIFRAPRNGMGMMMTGQVIMIIFHKADMLK